MPMIRLPSAMSPIARIRFVDTLALVRRHLWPATISYMSSVHPEVVEIPHALFDRLTDTLAFAA
jgi:hypothetical protein